MFLSSGQPNPETKDLIHNIKNMIESFTYQKLARLLHQYEFTINWNKNDEVHLLPAIVTVSFESGVTTIVDISIESDHLPEGFDAEWDPERAVREIEFELGDELRRLSFS